LAGLALAALLFCNALSVGRFMAAATPAAPRPGYGVTSFPTNADAPEYLPKGMLRMSTDGPATAIPYATLTHQPLAAGRVSTAWAEPKSGRLWVQLVDGPAARVVLRRFYFPAWRVDCDGRRVAAGADGPQRLLAFVAPAGARVCEAGIAPTPQEEAGAGLAVVAALLLGACAVWRLASFKRGPSPKGAGAAVPA
jgi:hypothetical protein